jgi:hypothetical protein
MTDTERDPSSAGDSYLWDGTGDPDPLVADLERRLSPLRYRERRPSRPAPKRARSRYVLLAVAAALLLAVPFLYVGDPGSSQGYEVTLLGGSARVLRNGKFSEGSVAIAPGVPQRFPVGSTLECDGGARAMIRIVGTGEVRSVGEATVEGPGRIELTSSSKELEKLFLHRGTLSARISASVRPRLFQVGTPSGTAVDLGCVYKMSVLDEGITELSVSVGRVAFEIGGRSVFVWSGATCRAERDRGVSTPVDDHTSSEFKEALARYELQHGAGELRALLPLATARDSATLWHLLQSAPESQRGSIYDSLARLVPPPTTTTKDDALRLDERAIEEWRVEIMGY